MILGVMLIKYVFLNIYNGDSLRHIWAYARDFDTYRCLHTQSMNEDESA